MLQCYQWVSAYTPLTSSPRTTSLIINRQRHSLASSEQLQKPNPSLSASTLSGSSLSDSTLFYSTLFPHSLIQHSDSTLSYLQLQHLTVHPADIISSCSTETSTSSIFSSPRNFILPTFLRRCAKKKKYLLSHTV